MHRLYAILPLLLLSTLSAAQNFTGGFNFYLPPYDSSEQRFLPEFPAGPVAGFVAAGAMGHFEVAGKPIRFWGVNLTTGACFPYKEKAAGIAARMRKMGINLVRFHHMDNPWSDDEGSLFRRDRGTTRLLNSATLDRLHFFLAQLRRNGIYANINLHVSRTFTPGDGVLYADSIPDFGKAVTMFDRQLIDLQKEFARQLLRTVNPYTGLPLAGDPVVAMVEITNENTLYGYWRGDLLEPLARGGKLLQRHVDTLDRKWHSFLRAKYAGQTSLADAWSGDDNSSGPDNQIDDGAFEGAQLGRQWILEQHEGATASVRLDADQAYEGQQSARITVSRVTGTDWHVQFKRNQLSVEKDSLYVVRFAARADRPLEIALSVMRDNSPWTWYAGQSFPLTTDWQEFVFSFRAPETNIGQFRVSLAMGNTVGTIWVDQVSLEAPGVTGLEEGESLAAGTVRRIRYGERLLYHPQRVADMAAFYQQLQRDYFEEMYRYLKDTLAVQAPITGSNALTGPADVYSIQSLDYVDDHAYWDHPWFPGIPWSPTDWLIGNGPMVQEPRLATIPQVFGGLAVAGKPYTVSEYNHAFPNRFETEMMPILAAYASLHGADGLMFFEYNGADPGDWETDKVDGFFSIHRNSALMALSPLYAFAYRNGLIRTDPDPLLVDYSVHYLQHEMPFQDNLGRWGKFFPYESAIGLRRAIRTKGLEATQASAFETLPEPETPPLITVSGETTFDPDRGLIITAAGQFISVAGFLPEAQGWHAGSLQLVEGSDFGVLAWLSLTGDPLEMAPRSLLALSSKVQNTGMVWDGSRTVHDQWGHSPTSVFPLSVRLRLALQADSVRLYRLDARGRERDARLYYPDEPGVFEIVLDQSQDKTLWYGLELLSGTVSVDLPVLEEASLKLFPNPVRDLLTLVYQSRKAAASVNGHLFDVQGRLVASKRWALVSEGRQQYRFVTADLPKGLYFFRLTVNDHSYWRHFVKQ
jgi:hypothetical protein